MNARRRYRTDRDTMLAPPYQLPYPGILGVHGLDGKHHPRRPYQWASVVSCIVHFICAWIIIRPALLGYWVVYYGYSVPWKMGVSYMMLIVQQHLLYAYILLFCHESEKHGDRQRR